MQSHNKSGLPEIVHSYTANEPKTLDSSKFLLKYLIRFIYFFPETFRTAFDENKNCSLAISSISKKVLPFESCFITARDSWGKSCHIWCFLLSPFPYAAYGYDFESPNLVKFLRLHYYTNVKLVLLNVDYDSEKFTV